MADTLGVRAFAFGPHIVLGSRTRADDVGVMAHETAHTIQQGSGERLQSFTDVPGDSYEREAQQASAAAVRGDTFNITRRTPSTRVQGLGLSNILDGLANLAANFPGFTLLTVILERNPINRRPVERTFANLLRGFMGLIVGGEGLFQVLQRYGVVERIGNWVSSQLRSLGLNYEYFRGRFTAFTDSLSWRDIFSPGDVWRRAQDIFAEPVSRIRTFSSRLIDEVITALKETFLRPLSEFCRRIPGYTLVTVLLGRDPFTNVPVERTALNVVRAFAEFIPGGTEKVNQLVESRALQRAYEWFTTETRARNLTWDRVTGTFAQAWNSLRFEDVLHPIDTLQRIVGMFRPLMSDLVGFAGAALLKLLELIFEAAMGAGGARVLAILKRARDTFLTIIRNPVGFLRNLLGAVGRGVRQFMTNILRHLREGVIAWLTGPVARAGIQMPERWDLRGIIWFVLQILGLTWDRVRAKLVRLMGERAVAMLETGFQLIQEIRQRGLVQALRERVTEFFGQLREAALGSIRSFIQDRLVRAGIEQLVSLLSPVGAIIQAIIKTYTTIKFFIDRINQILEFVESIVNSIAAIAAGSIGAAANFIERTMARAIPVILDFLARFIGLGDVGGHVQRTIQGLQARVDQMLDRAVDWIKNMAQRLVAAGRSAVGRVVAWWRKQRAFVGPDRRPHTIITDKQNGRPRVVMRSDERNLQEVVNTQPTNTRGDLQAKTDQLMTALSSEEHTAQREELEQRINRLLSDIAVKLGQVRPREFKPPETAAGPPGFPRRAKVMWADPLTNNPPGTPDGPPGEIRYRTLIANLIAPRTREVTRGEARVSERHWGFFRSAHLIASSLLGPTRDENLALSGTGLNGQMAMGPESSARRAINSGAELSYKTTVHYDTDELPPGSMDQVIAADGPQKRRWLGSVVARAFQVEIIALNSPEGRRPLFNGRITDPPSWLDHIFSEQGPASGQPTHTRENAVLAVLRRCAIRSPVEVIGGVEYVRVQPSGGGRLRDFIVAQTSIRDHSVDEVLDAMTEDTRRSVRLVRRCWYLRKDLL